MCTFQARLGCPRLLGSVWMLLLYPLVLRYQLIYAALDQTLIIGRFSGDS